MKLLFILVVLFVQLSHASTLPASLAGKTFVCTRPGESDLVATFNLVSGLSGKISFRGMSTLGMSIQYSATGACPFRLCKGQLVVGGAFPLIVVNSINIDLVLTGNHIGHGLLSFDNNGRLFETEITCIPQK